MYHFKRLERSVVRWCFGRPTGQHWWRSSLQGSLEGLPVTSAAPPPARALKVRRLVGPRLRVVAFKVSNHWWLMIKMIKVPIMVLILVNNSGRSHLRINNYMIIIMFENVVLRMVLIMVGSG